MHVNLNYYENNYRRYKAFLYIFSSLQTIYHQIPSLKKDKGIKIQTISKHHKHLH